MQGYGVVAIGLFRQGADDIFEWLSIRVDGSLVGSRYGNAMCRDQEIGEPRDVDIKHGDRLGQERTKQMEAGNSLRHLSKLLVPAGRTLDHDAMM